MRRAAASRCCGRAAKHENASEAHRKRTECLFTVGIPTGQWTRKNLRGALKQSAGRNGGKRGTMPGAWERRPTQNDLVRRK